VARTESLEIYRTYKLKSRPFRNLLIVAQDDIIQNSFSKELASVYETKSAPRIEDVQFWDDIDAIKHIYNMVVRIKPGKVVYKTFRDSLYYMEALKVPYDILLLTHGYPNHLSTGNGWFYSYKELEAAKGKYLHLDLVMLQSCYGQTLAKDFKMTGARHIMSYPALNRNFFFYGSFLKRRNLTHTIERDYQDSINSFSEYIKQEPYSSLLNLLINQTLSLKKGKFDSVLTNNDSLRSDFINSMGFPILD